MPEENASADTSAALAVDNGSNDSSSDPMAGLEAYFKAEQESAQVDNSDDQVAEPPADDAETAPAEAEEPTDAPEAEDEADKSAEPEAETTPEISTEADFDSLEKPPEFLDAEGLKAKFQRNASKDLIEAAANYSSQAKAGHELKESLGGEHFIPGVQQIASGLQTRHTGPIFEGIIAASGVDGLLSVISDTLDAAFVQADTFRDGEDASSQLFGKALGELADGIIQRRFGAHLSTAKIEKLSALAEAGWLEKLEKWEKDEWVDSGEAQELIATANDPKLRAILAEKAELKAKLDAKDAQAQAAADQQQSEVETRFLSSITEQVVKTLETVQEKSILRDLATDTDEVKAEKALLRDLTKNRAIEAFQSSEARANLLTGFKQGKGNTGQFRTDLVSAINSAVLQTKEITAIGERMVAKLYGTTRNGKLAAAEKAKPKQPEKEPTPPPNPPAVNSSPIQSISDIDKALDAVFANAG